MTYLSGRTPELDELFLWCEAQPTEIVRASDYSGCLDCAAPEMVSQQLWALLGGLLKGDALAKRTFANVQGTMALRRSAELLGCAPQIVHADGQLPGRT